MKVKRNFTKNGKHRIELIFDDIYEMNHFNEMAHDAYDVTGDNAGESLLDLLYTSSSPLDSPVPFDPSTQDRLNITDAFPE